MKTSEKGLLAVAVVLTLFGLFIMLGTTVEIFDRTSKDSVGGDIAGFILAGIVPLAVGVWLFWRTLKGAAKRALEARELTVIHLARQHHGVLTVPQVAEESGMTLEQAAEILDRLYHKSFNEKTLAESGELIYRFQGQS